ncbi:hypothetical protein KIH74_21925 [Kineosporia sp. J2-2]|uniref:Uncharacterized protein n=1 Tax=Kineosporia corallincola TaxID=2835133 RepID=A0ABS5TNI0_9ACTN|nr:hypothetical protein [Kineosporia corallincola]MBT0771613.1 hypothetical protein [Kineosporia corallincola]
MSEHDSKGPRRRGRHLARRLRDRETDTSAVQWEQSSVVLAHTGGIPVVDDLSARVSRLQAIRDHLSAPDPA